MSRKIVMTLVCILVLGLSGCGDTLTLNQYNTSEIWYIAYTDIDTVCESNELTADGSSILHSEEDYLLLSYVVDSNIEITKELKDGGVGPFDPDKPSMDRSLWCKRQIRMCSEIFRVFL